MQKLAEIKALQDKLGGKTRDLQAGRKAAPFKSVAEVDAQIKCGGASVLD